MFYLERERVGERKWGEEQRGRGWKGEGISSRLQLVGSLTQGFPLRIILCVWIVFIILF